MLVLSLLPLLLATAGFAAPSRRQSSCIPASALKLPKNQHQLVAPNDSPDFVTLGVGTQNYSCSDSGKYTSTGAAVQVFDISSLYCGPHANSLFFTIQDHAFVDWSNSHRSDPYDPSLARKFEDKYRISVSGQHYFVEKDQELVPVWDFTSSGPTKGNQDAIVFAAVVATIPSPNGPPSVDWVELKGVYGKLATKVFRVLTVGGDPPGHCTPGSGDITVKFTTQYYLYGSEL